MIPMKKNLLVFALLLLSAAALAQKLPDVQELGLTAPANIRIDGKATEWNDTYAAENKRTALFYSVANDDKNLYLIIKSANSASINKIMLGGITFTVNSQGKKREKDAVAITYPLVPRGNRNGGARNRQSGFGGFQNRNQLSQEQRDSAALVAHKSSLATVKEIKIAGIKSITDSLISIYNEHGIKAVAAFDKAGALVYELAVPLNLLALADANAKEFVYQIKVNGLSNTNFGRFNGGGNFGGGNGGRSNGGGGFGNRNAGSSNVQDLMSPTDFWGKYTLIKK